MATMGAEGMEIMRRILEGEDMVDAWRTFCEKWGLPASIEDLKALGQMSDMASSGALLSIQDIEHKCNWGSLTDAPCPALGTVKILGLLYCQEHAKNLKHIEGVDNADD
jgi:hypothetical protein